jgi:hypothetical protein
MDPRQLDLLAQEHSLHGMGLGNLRRGHFYISALALLISLAVVWRIGFRHDLLLATATSIFWVKLLFPLMLALVALVAWRMTLHPGFELSAAGWLIATYITGYWVLSLGIVLPADKPTLRAEFLGTTWHECIAYIAVISLPMTACLMWISRVPVRGALPRARAAFFGELVCFGRFYTRACGRINGASFAEMANTRLTVWARAWGVKRIVF